MFQSLFKYSNNGIVITIPVDEGQDFIIKDINPEAEKIEKVKKEEVLGKRITEFWPEIEKFSLLTTMRNVYKTGEAEAHPTTFYADNRISGWRENFVYKTATGEIVTVYYDRTEEKIAEQKLRENEEKNAAIIKALPDLFFKFDSQGTFIDCWTNNPKLMLYPRESIIGKSVCKIMPKDVADKTCEAFKTIMETKEAVNFEYDLAVCGELRTFDARLVYDSPYSVLAIIRDITDKRKMIHKIEEQEQKFKTIFQTNPDAILLTTIDEGKIVDVNEAAVKLIGLPLEEILGKTTIGLKSWFSPEHRAEYIKNLIRYGTVNNFETKFNTENGTIDALVSGEVIKINGVNHILSIVRNISDLRKINKQLKFSEQKFKDIVENISEIVMEMDKDHIITFANKGVYDITGYTAEEIVGSPVHKYFTKESAKTCDKVHSEALRKKDTSIHNVICEFICKNGDNIFLSIQWKIAWMNGDGPKTYMVARDVTAEEINRRFEKAKEDKFKAELKQTLVHISKDLTDMVNKRGVE